MTMAQCPHGCGTCLDFEVAYCPGCRRGMDEIPIQPPGSCWAWWGPKNHRMRCRRPVRHIGEHSTHDDCDEEDPIGSIDENMPILCLAGSHVINQPCPECGYGLLRIINLWSSISLSNMADICINCHVVYIGDVEQPRWHLDAAGREVLSRWLQKESIVRHPLNTNGVP